MDKGIINMERTLIRTKSKRYCKAFIRLTDQPGGHQRLSITGETGRIVSKAAARKEAKQYWISFFEDSPEEIFAMNERCGTRFSSASGAAKYVLDMDGEYHGLDAEEVDGKMYLLESCGRVHDDIAEWFPEAVPLIEFHLNDMQSCCEHQRLRGETYSSNPKAICPDCQYKIGSAWLVRELPPEIVELAKTVLKDEEN
jgi:hypothetical protein